MSTSYRDDNLHGMVDLFSVSIATLLADVMQYLIDNNVPHSAHIVHDDVITV